MAKKKIEYKKLLKTIGLYYPQEICDFVNSSKNIVPVMVEFRPFGSQLYYYEVD